MRMTVAEFRDLTDELSQAFRSLKSARPEERAREAAWVRRVAREVMDAEVPKRMQASDRKRAEGLVDATAVWLTENGL